MILVTGATGQFGTNAIGHLLDQGTNPSGIAALVRDPAGAADLQQKGIEIRTGDYTDYQSLVQGFKGIDKLLLVSSSDKQAVENRTAQHINAIKAAKEAGVKHVIYTSFIRKPGFEDSAITAFQHSHVQSETFLKESGITYTILQNGIYLEMIPIFTGDKVNDTGSIFFPAGEGRASYVLRSELAEAAAHVLTTSGHENKVYQLINMESASFADIAGAISGTIEKDVTYQSPSVTEFESALKRFGMSEAYIGIFTMWALAISEGTMDATGHTLEQFLGRKPTTIKQFIDQLYNLK